MRLLRVLAVFTTALTLTPTFTNPAAAQTPVSHVVLIVDENKTYNKVVKRLLSVHPVDDRVGTARHGRSRGGVGQRPRLLRVNGRRDHERERRGGEPLPPVADGRDLL